MAIVFNAESVRALLGALLGSAALSMAVGVAAGCAAEESAAGKSEMTIEVEIPVRAEDAAGKAAPVAILVLEALELDPRESLTLEVRGPRDRARNTPGPLLATTGTVGAPSDPAGPVRIQLDLAVPLQGEALKLLEEARKAGRKTLELELAADQPLRYRRVYFKPAPPR